MAGPRRTVSVSETLLQRAVESFDSLIGRMGKHAAAALFAYQNGEFMSKYAHLEVEPDRRIASATGFGYEWTGFHGPEEAWELVKACVGAGAEGSGSE